MWCLAYTPTSRFSFWLQISLLIWSMASWLQKKEKMLSGGGGKSFSSGLPFLGLCCYSITKVNSPNLKDIKLCNTCKATGYASIFLCTFMNFSQSSADKNFLRLLSTSLIGNFAWHSQALLCFTSPVFILGHTPCKKKKKKAFFKTWDSIM